MASGDKLQQVTNLSSPIWERQHYEKPKPYAYFELFRDMGPHRTMRALAEEIGLSHDYIREVSIRWRWPERIRAWDDHIAAIKIREVEDASATMANRQARLGMMLQDKAITALAVVDLEKPTVRDVVALADAGVKIERTARGEVMADTGSITMVFPTLPKWAKTSQFIQTKEVEQLTEGEAAV